MFRRKRSVERPNPSVRNRRLGYFFNRLMHRDLDCFRMPRPQSRNWTLQPQPLKVDHELARFCAVQVSREPSPQEGGLPCASLWKLGLAPNKKPWAARPPKVVFAVRFYLAKLAQAILQRRGLSIERVQWFQSEAFFDCLENRKRVVLSVVHKMVLGQRSDNDSGNARTIAPDAGNWRCHVIPAAAVFVIGHNDESVAPIVAVFHCAHKIRNVLLTLQQAGVSGMLIVGSQRLNKDDRRQAFGLQIQEEVVLILQVRGGYWIADAILERSIVVIIGEGLVVPLEQGVDGSVLRNDAVVGGVAGRAGQGIVPAARIPLPTDVVRAEAVADCRRERARRIGRVAVIQGWQQGRGEARNGKCGN